MFKNKSKSGENNICGKKIYTLRKQHIPKGFLRSSCKSTELTLTKTLCSALKAGKGL